jgi:hypothetical protein
VRLITHLTASAAAVLLHIAYYTQQAEQKESELMAQLGRVPSPPPEPVPRDQLVCVAPAHTAAALAAMAAAASASANATDSSDYASGQQLPPSPPRSAPR